jgi:hypothetical protein
MTFLKNKTFYPTPPGLAKKMVEKIDLDGRSAYEITILEPSAGAGDLVEALNENRYDGFSGNGTFRNISAIEIDPDLQATLMGKRIKVIDSDFLAYSGADKFDLIIANPPFDDGDKHLLKAIDILYRGQIIFLLNAETIRNPYTNTRKLLSRKLEELDAEIEYIPGAFKDADRPTGVEVALVNIKIERKVEDDLFKGCDDKADDPNPEFEEKYEVATGRKIEDLVAEYNDIVRIGTETIIGYYRNYRKIGALLGLNREAKDYHLVNLRSESEEDLTSMMQAQLNSLLHDVRKKFWLETLRLPEVEKRLTKSKRDAFRHDIKLRCDMDFTERNIREFILNVIEGYEKTLMDATLEIFDLLTVRHSWDGNNPNEENIHYFNGWKTNKAWKVGKKVIIPCRLYKDASYSWADWKVGYDDYELRDIDTVMNYFDGMGGYLSMRHALDYAFKQGRTKKVESTYFTITCYKKGTVHLIFNDENILRRFNVAACIGKKWLPVDYGKVPYQDLPLEKRTVAESFEGRESYNANLRQPLFGKATTVPLIEEYAATGYKGGGGVPKQQTINFE